MTSVPPMNNPSPQYGFPPLPGEPSALPATPPAMPAALPGATQPTAPSGPVPAPDTAQTIPAAAPYPVDPAPETAPVPGQLSAAHARLSALRTEVGKAVVGQDGAVTGLVVGLLAGGHVLLEGVPGTAKTLLVRALATALQVETKRIQFTPDLMPGDVTGSLIYDSRAADFVFKPGPVFTNLLLADEINRTPPKTQASLLEAMAEHQVSVDGIPRPLPDPFMVIATQNPIEYEGTYPLPEAQLDRFLLKLVMHTPDKTTELEILSRHEQGFNPSDLTQAGLRAVAGPGDIAAARAEVARVGATTDVLGYIVDIVQASRVSPALSLGVSPRGATALLATARAWAWLSGRNFVTPDDVKTLTHPTLQHRIQVRPEARLEGVSAGAVLDTILTQVAVPR